jgi:sn-glycerol 3-phosphate transport system ATP-binding protein
VVALAGIDFEVRAGELLVLLGPSGCGKSTTLRIIAGLEAASAGTIRFGDRSVDALPAAQRGISMVFQSYALYPHLNVRENILFGLKVRRIAPVERERRLGRAAELLGIGGLLLRKPAQLSGGQKQRVALGRAIVAEAAICLMDEPLSNLDAQLRQEMRTEIRSLQQRLGMTMIYVTHDQTEAMTMADQIILLRDGRIEQKGTAHELYARPQTSFVARFIGTPPMGLLRFDDVAARNALADASSLPALPGEIYECLLGLRPETIRLAAAGLLATVVAVEYLGADSIVLCDVAGQRLAVRVAGVPEVTAGAQVHLNWNGADQHLFDGCGQRADPVATGPRL